MERNCSFSLEKDIFSLWTSATSNVTIVKIAPKKSIKIGEGDDLVIIYIMSGNIHLEEDILIEGDMIILGKQKGYKIYTSKGCKIYIYSDKH
ncbi:hypothetical protein [Bacillus toyonensis]|uniref:hypothetical protein n=1 Tax=Bacillus toyonensis TaxID=155322 RepID=UPI000BF0D66C|nr:hypothetical protein [Bacillus toyonensis]PEM43188.1 hypothetical protein CN636_17190 [Bacillus toyonensis]